MLLLDRRTLDPSRRLHGHGRAVSLATIFDKHYPMLCDMACRANERMVLDTTDSNRFVRDHVRSGSTRRHRLMALQKRLPSLLGAGTPVPPRRENEFAHAEKDMTTYGNRVGILTSSSNILLSVPFAQFSGADDSGPNVPIHLRDCRGYPGVGSQARGGS